MSKFNFKNLIRKYSKSPSYEEVKTNGAYDFNQGGIWVDGITENVLIPDAAVVPLKPEELNYGEGGTYTLEDRKLYCYSIMKKGAKVNHKGKSYTIQEELDFEDYDTGLHIYFMKRGGV